MVRKIKERQIFQSAAFSDEIIDEAFALHEKGMSTNEIYFMIQEKFRGRKLPAPGTVRGWIKKYKDAGKDRSKVFKDSKRLYTREIQDAAMDMFYRGSPPSKIAKKMTERYSLDPPLTPYAVSSWAKKRGIYRVPGHPDHIKKMCVDMLVAGTPRKDIIVHLKKAEPEYKKKYKIDYPVADTISYWRSRIYPNTKKKKAPEYPESYKKRARELIKKHSLPADAMREFVAELEKKGVKNIPSATAFYKWTRGIGPDRKWIRYPQRVHDEIERLHFEKGYQAAQIVPLLHDKYKSTQTPYPKNNKAINGLLIKMRKKRRKNE